MNDEELVEGLIRGESRAYHVLLDRFQNKLIEYLLRFRSLSRGDVEEIADDVLNWIIDHPSCIDLARGSIAGLIFTKARSKAIDRLRQLKTHGVKRTISLESHGDKLISGRKKFEALQVMDEYASEDDSVYQPLFSPEVLDASRQLIAELKLTETQIEHLRLRKIEKLQPKEIAAFLGISANNESVRWHRLWTKIERTRKMYPVLLEYAQEREVDVISD